ncbi:Os03g0251950, partial [Oryza sativa Japonica Group]
SRIAIGAYKRSTTLISSTVIGDTFVSLLAEANGSEVGSKEHEVSSFTTIFLVSCSIFGFLGVAQVFESSPLCLLF